MFEEVCLECGSEESVDIIQFNKSLQAKFGLMKEICSLLFEHADDKFIYDDKQKKSLLNFKYLRWVKEYTIYKRAVLAASEEGKVDIKLLLSFIDELDVKITVSKTN